jgi:hypothetical protein
MKTNMGAMAWRYHKGEILARPAEHPSIFFLTEPFAPGIEPLTLMVIYKTYSYESGGRCLVSFFSFFILPGLLVRWQHDQ